MPAIRALNFDRETAQMLKESGCKKISIGVESGDENLRRTVLNRDMKDEQIIMAFEYAREAGLETMSFNMIGFWENQGRVYVRQ